MKALSNKDLKKLLESIIFTANKPVTIKELNYYFKDIETKELKSVLKELINEWDNADHGFHLVEVSNGYQLRTKSEYSDEIIDFNKEIKKFRISKASLEVLAITAYKQPLTRLEIEQIRGVDCSGVINQLLDKRLMEIRGRKDVPGKPFIYGTTDEFLETFNLKSIKDLPTLQEIEDMEPELKLEF